jgi:C4-dicarboxylate-specific signal transduction histidine kinase
MQTININESAQRAVSLLIQKLHNHGIGFEIKISDESLYILANLLQIELIINNLVVNSIYSVDKARSKGKSIILETYGDERYVYLNVKDNGLGLPDVHLDKLFDPFFTTKPPEEGSGLGLAIVKMFVNRFEGKIDAYNNEEGGATFAIRFPRKKLME